MIYVSAARQRAIADKTKRWLVGELLDKEGSYFIKKLPLIAASTVTSNSGNTYDNEIMFSLQEYWSAKLAGGQCLRFDWDYSREGIARITIKLMAESSGKAWVRLEWQSFSEDLNLVRVFRELDTFYMGTEFDEFEVHNMIKVLQPFWDALFSIQPKKQTKRGPSRKKDDSVEDMEDVSEVEPPISAIEDTTFIYLPK